MGISKIEGRKSDGKKKERRKESGWGIGKRRKKIR